jgi:hypothetical protein
MEGPNIAGNTVGYMLSLQWYLFEHYRGISLRGIS